MLRKILVLKPSFPLLVKFCCFCCRGLKTTNHPTVTHLALSWKPPKRISCLLQATIRCPLLPEGPPDALKDKEIPLISRVPFPLSGPVQPWGNFAALTQMHAFFPEQYVCSASNTWYLPHRHSAVTALFLGISHLVSNSTQDLKSFLL